MKLSVGDTKQIVGGNEAKLWGNEVKFVWEIRKELETIQKFVFTTYKTRLLQKCI